MERVYFVYIVTNRKNGTLYTGVTNDLLRRTYEHRDGEVPGFAKTNGCDRLVWYDHYHDINAAIDEEKRVKKWLRRWKVKLIETMNPDWRDLWWDIIEWGPS